MEILETNRLKFALCPEVGAEPTPIEAVVECDVVAGVPVSASLFTCGWSHRVDYESDDNETTEEMRQKNEDLSLLRRRDLPPLARHNNPFFTYAMFLCRIYSLREGHMQGGVRLRRAESHRLGRPPDGCLSHMRTEVYSAVWAGSFDSKASFQKPDKSLVKKIAHLTQLLAQIAFENFLRK